MALLLMSSALAVSDQALEIANSLELAQQDLDEMQNMSNSRYSDTLFSANQLYAAQLALENTTGVADYSSLKIKISELKQLKDDALLNSDELKALWVTIEQTEGIDPAPVMKLYFQAEEEFEAERYENSFVSIEETYEKISELQAVETKIKALYDATSSGIINFLKKTWKYIAGILAAIFLLVFIFHNTWIRYRIRAKIVSLSQRKISIQALISQTQKTYFEKGEIDEGTYHIRVKKYGEMIRDLSRQIPLLREQLAMKQKKYNEKTKKGVDNETKQKGKIKKEKSTVEESSEKEKSSKSREKVKSRKKAVVKGAKIKTKTVVKSAKAKSSKSVKSNKVERSKGGKSSKGKKSERSKTVKSKKSERSKSSKSAKGKKSEGSKTVKSKKAERSKGSKSAKNKKTKRSKGRKSAKSKKAK